MGHFLEHFGPEEADALLAECLRVLIPGGVLGVVVPDMRALMAAWLRADPRCIEYPPGTPWRFADLDDLCAMFVFSTVQPSQHRWAYCHETLARRLNAAGFDIIGPIDPLHDRRLSTPQWWQMGLEARKP